MRSSLAWAAPAKKTATAPTQVVSRKLRIGILPATVPRVTDARALRVPRVGTHSMGRLPAPCHSATRRNLAIVPRLAFEHTSELPLHLTYLKPEAARSLFPRLIDRNQKRSIHHFPRKPCSPGCAAARALPAHAERHVGQRQFH